MPDEKPLRINRAPVLTLWGAVVAERAGYDRAEALTLGRAVAGLNAQSKGRRLGVFDAPDEDAPKRRGKRVTLLGRAVPVVKTSRGVRAAEKGKAASAPSVEKYLKEKFGDSLPEVRKAMERLARAYEPDDLEEIGFSLYEQFRPRIPEGARGWGAKGALELERIRSLADRGR